ncbi:MAG: hypothetical protein M9894_31365 [Planctomycetes bacterium]|nr:hypothetical protein [Planctomycetota bacterium]
MPSTLTARLERALLLTEALAAAVDDPTLARDIAGAPSNRIGDQFWCLVGGRESYARAIAAGAWSGFSCSLGAAEARRAEAVRSALARAREAALEAASRHDLAGDRAGLAFDLLEHEAQHHGQLIRYFYANGVAFPPEFARRYALSQPGA